MSKRLTVTYGDAVLYDDEPEQFQWSETNAGAITLKAGPVQPNPLAGAMEQLASAARKSPRQIVG